MNIKYTVVAMAILFFNFNLQAQKQFKAFLFTKTAGWHHESINEGVTAIKKLAQRNNFDVVWEENAARCFTDEFLKDFDVIIFLNTTEDILNDEQQEVFKKFIQSGKGFVGVHSASDTEYDWPWYNSLVGKMFHIHPAQQTAVLEVQDTNFPGMEVFPPRFMWTDEWYEFKKEEYSKNLQVLLTVDETTYKPYAKWGEKEGKGMGYHPIAWYQYFDGGRSFYTALGHIPAIYENSWFLQHLYGGIYWAATGNGIKK
ncbi:ThuA domain-containing protein [Abyssalbus ytuae]|uniref:ThuA domain-containing protein n=1 Tax=Abyssalbus ytuae TaxID=2926907 RepID=A0A9E7D252_9FLAO|nr:ThuA domain-containing protein [Abyssalbus ytuae]UOB16329.1 ThuA domain-containing protein [Abyssalbus ytuae]